MDSTWRQNNGVNPLHLKAIDDLTTKWFCNKEPENVQCHAQKFDDDDDGCLSDDNSHPQEKFKDKVDAPTEPQISRSSNDNSNLTRKKIKENVHDPSSSQPNAIREYLESLIGVHGAQQNINLSYNLPEDVNPKGTHDVHKDDEHSKLQSKNEVKGRSAALDNEAQQSRCSIIETVVPLDVNLETISGNPFRNLVEQIGYPPRSVPCNLSTVADDPLNHGREGLVYTEPFSSKSSKTSKKKRRKVPLKPKLKEHQTKDGYKQKLGLDCDPKFVQDTVSGNYRYKTLSAENECCESTYDGTKVGHLEIEHKVHRYSGFTVTSLGSAFPVTVTLAANAYTSSLELLDGRFKAEQYRYASFEPIQSRLTPPPSRLAKNGLFYDREANTIACFCCGISLREEEWESLRSPETRHLQLVEHNNLTCHFIRGDECGNIPWGTSSAGPATSPTDQQSSNTEILVSSENWNGAGQNGHSGNEESDSHGTLYTDSEILPQSSNNHLPAEQQQQPRAEFSHSGVVNGSNVVAAVAVAVSSPENNLTEVVKASGTAVFESSLANLTSSGQFQPQVQTIQVYHSTTAISASFRPSTASAQVRYPVQVEQDPQGTPNQPSNRFGQLNDHDEAPGLDMRRAVSPGNALVAVRIATFASWPGRNLPLPRVLVLAGFYYMGIGDSVRCFYCGVTLKNWRANDDVWETHVRFRFSCDYVHFIKGDDFVCRTLVKLANGGRIPAESGLAALPSTQSATNGSCTPACDQMTGLVSSDMST